MLAATGHEKHDVAQPDRLTQLVLMSMAVFFELDEGNCVQFGPHPVMSQMSIVLVDHLVDVPAIRATSKLSSKTKSNSSESCLTTAGVAGARGVPLTNFQALAAIETTSTPAFNLSR